MRFFHKSSIFVLVIPAIILSGCSNAPENIEGNSNTGHLVRITHEQFNAEQMELGNTVMHTFTRVYRTNGIASASPRSRADVYSYISGIIRSVSVNLGSRVKKGQELCTIESKEFITLQQQYLEALAKLKATELDYQRIKTLYDENISSHKEFIAIESKYKILKATIKALKAELKMLHVNIPELEKGNISIHLRVLAPVQGTITEQNVNIGQFVDSQELLMKIIDNSDLQLIFYVYQENVNKLKNGQILDIYTPGNPKEVYKATIISLGKAIDPDTKSIECLARPEDRVKEIFVDGMYFQVEVELDTVNSLALPSQAILKTDNRYYVLVKEKEDDNSMYFRKEKVNPGIVAGDYTQVLGNKPLKEVLVKGTYYFQTQ